MAEPHFARVALVGVGHINGSLAKVLRREGLAERIVGCARRETTLEKARALKLVDETTTDPAAAVEGADLVMLGTPVGAYAALAERFGPRLAPGSILTDVGSIKEKPIRDVAPHVPPHAQFVPGHPIAGTEHSGPEAAFDTLFEGRWCILTPLPETEPEAVERVAEMWRRAGSMIEFMGPEHHDKVLAITSHLPHLIAYTIVATVDDLETFTKSEVIRYAASGFRDFTRIAASDPVMWRDIFLNNREAVLEMLGRFNEDLTALQRAIRWGDGETLEKLFTRTRAIRRALIEAKQA